MKTETFYLLENRPDVWLKSYIWEDSPQLLNGRNRPAVIICPGGGYLQAGDNEGERAELLSPSRNVDENTPPTFLWAVADDTLVPVQNTLLMGTALADHNVPFEMHIFEHGQHGIGLGTQASAGTKEQIFEDAGKWSDLAGKWLEKRFALFG